MANELFKVIVGIDTHADTHADTHHVALITDYGNSLRAASSWPSVPATGRSIAAYLTSFWPVTAVGVEETRSYGAELARLLAGQGFIIIEVNRPNRAAHCLRSKSDSLDAYQAAESVLADRGISTLKARGGYVEALRVLRSEAVFAALAGAVRIPASSGKTNLHRLSRSRQLTNRHGRGCGDAQHPQYA